MYVYNCEKMYKYVYYKWNSCIRCNDVKFIYKEMAILNFSTMKWFQYLSDSCKKPIIMIMPFIC